VTNGAFIISFKSIFHIFKMNITVAIFKIHLKIIIGFIAQDNPSQIKYISISNFKEKY